MDNINYKLCCNIEDGNKHSSEFSLCDDCVSKLKIKLRQLSSIIHDWEMGFSIEDDIDKVCEIFSNLKEILN